MEQEPDYAVVGENMARTDWLNARRFGIGGSDSPAILGLSKYGGPLSVYATKMAQADFEADKEPRFRRLGRELEPVMLRLAQEEVGADGHRHTPNTLFRSTLHPWMLCTMDGELVWDRGDRLWCEVKTGADAEDWNNGVPESVETQTQHQLFVTGADELVVALFFTGWAADYAVTRIRRNEAYIQDVLLPATEAFWFDHVEPQNEKGLEVDGSDYTRKALDLLHPEEQDAADVVLAGEEWLHKTDELRALAEERKQIEAREKLLKNEFRQQIGGAKRLLLSDGTYFSNTFMPESEPMVRKAHTRFLGPFGGTK